MSNSIFATKKEVLWEKVENGIAITNPETNRVFFFNATGAAIWQMIDGRTTVRDIASQLEVQFDLGAEVILPDVINFIQRLLTLALIDEKQNGQ